MAQISGNTTDFVDGTDTCQNLAQAVYGLTVGRYYGTDTTDTQNYVISVASDFRLTTGVVVWVLPTNGNSGGPPTLNVNGTGVKPVVNRANVALLANEVGPGKLFGAVYDGTSYRIITPLARVYSGANPGQPVIECAGFDSVNIKVSYSVSTSSLITLAHLGYGIPASIYVYNGYTAAQTYQIQATNPAGTACNVYWIWASTTAGVIPTRIDQTAISLSVNSGILFRGALDAVNELILL
jgi:hypothetical protein